MALPRFLVVGAAKSGTTSLYYYLKEHPEIYLNEDIKESFYFCGLPRNHFCGVGKEYGSGVVTDIEQYKRLFADAVRGQIIGEICVGYLYYHSYAISNITRTLGSDVKIIIQLRNPVDRAYSNYMHHVRDGIENLSFKDAIAAENVRMQNGYWWGFQYLSAGLYYHQVKSYIEAFGVGNVLITLYDEFVRDTHGVLKEIFRFIGVDENFKPNIKIKYNTSGIPKNMFIHNLMINPSFLTRTMYSVLPKKLANDWLNRIMNYNLKKLALGIEMREYLARQYRDDVLKLQALTGKDLSMWLSGNVR